MAIFNSYVKLPEGMLKNARLHVWMTTWDARACQEQGNWHGMTGKDELYDNVINPNHYQKIPKMAGSFRLVPPPETGGVWWMILWLVVSNIFHFHSQWRTYFSKEVAEPPTYIYIYTYLYFHLMSFPIIFPWYLHNLMGMVNHITAFFWDTRPGLKLLQELDLGKLKQEGDVGSVW